MSDLESQNLHTKERRIAIARECFEKKWAVKGIDLAKRYGVNPSQISADMRHDEFWNEMERLRDDHICKIVAEGWELVGDVIMDAKAARSETPPIDILEDDSPHAYKRLQAWEISRQRVIDRGVQEVNFLLEHTDRRFSKKYEIDLKVAAPEDDIPKDIIHAYIDEIAAEGAFLVPIGDTIPSGNGNGNGHRNGEDQEPDSLSGDAPDAG